MINELWIEPPLLHFKHNQEDELKKTLDTDRHLILSPLNEPKDVFLDAEAKIAGIAKGQKYKLTRWALFQLCQLTCQSMYGYVTDLAGANRTKDSDREDYSFSAAVDTINQMVKRRFRTHLQGKVALVDNIRGTIDGFVSAQYRWLPNYELYDRTKEAMTQVEGALFLEAILVGRWMMLRFVEQKPLVRWKGTCNDGEIEDLFFQGYHFSNNEVGKASVKAANMLYRKFSKSAAILPVSNKDNSLRHLGIRFEVRFGEMIKHMLTHQFEHDEVDAGLACLGRRTLGLGNKSAKAEEKRIDDITAKLVRRGIPVTIAKSIVTNAAHQGSYDEVPIEPVLYRPKERTAFDLYNALGRCAISLPINHRERAEQVAHAIFTGKVTFD